MCSVRSQVGVSTGLPGQLWCWASEPGLLVSGLGLAVVYLYFPLRPIHHQLPPMQIVLRSLLLQSEIKR
ncbi:hypothetical protein CEXT_736951 [Caerostris extrusa]|uniref:Uncharacterized protein n=1 Tax=Caerostris extrusa TaxID=172846 RepID=A0AAV4MMQ2_CAEEX|nr:hypothetical protein CEXT_736951 [Caerostris extrusa]